MISETRPLILGSASPRRRDILSGLGIPIRVQPADAAEQVAPGEAPPEYLQRIVAAKLALVAVSRALGNHAGILVADTIVVIDGQVLGKPSDVADAERLLRRLVGRAHHVYTRYAISLAAEPERASVERSVCSLVCMRAASQEEIERYARSGEGLDKAGAYAVQGLGAFLIERIEGSYSNVVGLPACEVVVDLRTLGLLERFPR